ncbi:MAG: hypothetical protein M1371_07475 [Actinobacteria bacterium]|nr:hypothetical protein [Actinomycetota bacterium]
MRKVTYFLVIMFLVLPLVLISCQPKAEVAATTAAPETVVVEKTVEVEKELTPVNVGTAPYSMFQLPHATKDLGFDRDIGLDFTVKEYTSTSPATKALIRGEVDIVTHDIPELVPFIKTAPQVKTIAPLDLFKGFIFIGRKGEWKPWDELVQEMGLEKAKEFRLNEFKGKTFLGIPFRFALISDAVAQVGLTDKDYVAKTYADDQLAATAFIGGDGDVYTGSLPQEIELLKQPDKYVNLGGQEILGPMGLWYGNIATTDKYLADNREAVLRYLAAQFRSIRLFNEQPDKIVPILNENLRRVTGTEGTDEDYIELETVYDQFITIEWAKENYFNPDSPYYWKIAADYNIKVAADSGVIDKVVPAEEFMPQDDLFNELIGRQDLMDYINKPF